MVDRLQGLRGAEDFASMQEPSLQATAQTPSNCLGTGYVDHTGAVWQVLQLHALVQSPEFLNIRM